MKIVKILIVFVIFFIVTNFINVANVFATDEEIKIAAISITDINQKATNFETTGKGSAKITKEDAESAFLPIGKILVLVATTVVVIVTGIMGIKWITANPEQQGKLKQQLIGLVVSIVVIYGAVGIWQIVVNIMDN